jgi:hypothetical protein
MPGYSYPGFDYDGMFAWFSFKKPYVRLHVRPPVVEEHSKELAGYLTTKAIVSFPMDKRTPVHLQVVRLQRRIRKQVTAAGTHGTSLLPAYGSVFAVFSARGSALN